MRKQIGISLMEIVIGLAIMSAALIAVLRMQSTQQAQVQGQKIAQRMEGFRELSLQFLLSNHAALLTALHDGTDADKFCRIAATSVNSSGVLSGGTASRDAAKKTCAWDEITLKTLGLLPPGYATPAATDDRPVFIVRRIYQPGPDGVLGTADDVATQDLEAIVAIMDGDGVLTGNFDRLNQDPSANARVQEIVKQLGEQGGVVASGNLGYCLSNATQVEACGQGWKMTLDRFISNAQYNTMKSAI